MRAEDPVPEEEYEYTSVRDRKKQFVETRQDAPRKFSNALVICVCQYCCNNCCLNLAEIVDMLVKKVK